MPALELTRRHALGWAAALGGAVLENALPAMAEATGLGGWTDWDGLPASYYVGHTAFPKLPAAVRLTPWCAHAHSWPLHCYLEARA